MPHNDSASWNFDPKVSFVPVYYEGAIAGFFKPDMAPQIVDFLNAQDKLQKALRLACLDYIRKSGGDTNRVDELIKKYMVRAERPRYGSRAIAALLRDRQVELNVSDREFVRFCSTYKLPLEELKEIYAGEEIIDSQLPPIARILGMSLEELIELRDGPNRPQE